MIMNIPDKLKTGFELKILEKPLPPFILLVDIEFALLRNCPSTINLSKRLIVETNEQQLGRLSVYCVNMRVFISLYKICSEN